MTVLSRFFLSIFALVLPVAVYAAPPPTASLPQSANVVARWFLEEVDGVRFDAVSNNDLSDNNTVLSGSGFVGTGATFLRSADFEVDNNEFLSITDNAELSPTNSISFFAWVKLESFPLNSQRFIGAKSKPAARSWFSMLENQAGLNVICLYINDTINNGPGGGGPDGGSQHCSANLSLPLDTFLHVGSTFDHVTGTIRHYLDGVKVATISTNESGIGDFDSDFLIGGFEFNLSRMDGLIQDPILWSSTTFLSDAEVSDLYDLYVLGAPSIPPAVVTGSILIFKSACQSFTGDVCNLWETNIEVDAILNIRAEFGYILFAAIILWLKWFVILALLFFITRWLWRIVTRWKPHRLIFRRRR